MKLESEDEVIRQKVDDFFKGDNKWILPKIKGVEEDEYIVDAEMTFDGEKFLPIFPLYL